jgi:hypothetical protein
VLVTLKNLLQKYVKCRNLLENDGGGGSIGGTVAVSRKILVYNYCGSFFLDIGEKTI